MPQIIRNPRTSNEQLLKMIKEKKLKDEIYSFFPIDKHNCECQPEVNNLKVKLSSMPPNKRMDIMKKIGHIVCPRSKKGGYKRYRIICADCGETIAFIAAKNKDLTDWCDLHYYNYAKRITLIREREEPILYQRGPKKGQQKVDNKGKFLFRVIAEKIRTARWYGCATVNISPIDQELGFECFCGNDTRDFRTSATLPSSKIYAKLARRAFGKMNSGYLVKGVRK